MLTSCFLLSQIRGVTEADLGRYECHANNAHGEHKQGVELDSTRYLHSGQIFSYRSEYFLLARIPIPEAAFGTAHYPALLTPCLLAVVAALLVL